MASDEEEEVAAIEAKILSSNNGNCDNEAAKILLDSGATGNVVKPGYVKRSTSSKTVQVTRFDGSNTASINQEVYRVKFSSIDSEVVDIDPRVQELLKQYANVFPDRLPDELPPNRSIELDLTMSMTAQPSNRPPFRLSHIEQTDLMDFRRRTNGKRLDRSVRRAMGLKCFRYSQERPQDGCIIIESRMASFRQLKLSDSMVY
ncbi:hypothetical protein PsorP6_008788 [Peronosclerospora sorghi]|uniref:Uncharacterized protein n=1 Tax=Peronosclerospora sorghi TaxID=230839 RepID=A0ACC0VXY2_9STRA|nr:hypothetical protein PsorP6_008788 [Peronosclerospora sorghi]